MNIRPLLITLALLLGCLIGWVILDDATQVAEKPEEESKEKPKFTTIEPPKTKGDRKRDLSKKRVTLEDIIALPNQRLIKFSDEKSYRDFLAKLGNSDLKLLGNIDQLWVVGVGYRRLSDLTDLGVDENDLLHNFPVTVPQPGEVQDQPNAVGFGRSALEFLGITGDNSAFGEGVKVAIIDTGVEPHLALSKGFETINLIELPEGTEPHGHGTAVASLVAGDHPNMTGVAPSASILSIRVADESGVSNSLTLAQGIIAAVDNGAQIINISMGSYGNSLVVQEAIGYANQKGSVIFASSGNEGYGESAYPGANEGVNSVGAVDAEGTHLYFSNTSDELGMTAPGLEVQAAWPNDQVISFTGTSAASPFLAGATAALMSELNMSAQEAYNHLVEYGNEGGELGGDPYIGEGILNVGRALQHDTSGIQDIAVASQYFPSGDGASPYLHVLVENRGTEDLWRSSVEVNVDGSVYDIPINHLKADEVKAITIPITENHLIREGSLNVRSEVKVSSETNDIQPSNNRRTDTFVDPNLVVPDEDN